VNLPAQPSSEAGPPAGKQAAGNSNSPGPMGGETGKSGQGGASAQTGVASGGHGKGSHDNGPGTTPELLQKKYHSDNYAYILKIIQEHIVYPAKARREGLSGKATVSFVVLENGQVDNIRFLRSTGYEILDQNLIKTIKGVAPFPKPPKKAELQMQLSYRLEQ
jgi:protein TonB